MKDKGKRKDEFYSKLVSLVFPIAFQQFMLSLVSASDAVMLGKLNQDSLSAVSLAGQVMFGPAVTIATVGHPIAPDLREYMYTDPVTIGDNCWIGAGSVVVKDIPANSVAAGNPCRVIRSIDAHDKLYYYKNREISAEDLEEERSLR